MNTQTTFSFSPTDYLRHCTLSWLLFLLLSATGMAADLTFTPNAPIVEQGKQITLSVSGTSGEVTWTVAKGQIQGTDTQVTYVAPAQVGLDVVTVMDNEGNFASVKVVITPPNNVSLENASWEIFTNRSNIQALLLSDDGKTLWVGTDGGLEKRDAQTGEIQQIFLNTDGLPGNNIKALLSDNQGGLWVGTEGGLGHLSAQGQWQVFQNGEMVSALLSDGQGGLWVGTGGGDVWQEGGLTHYDAQGQWQKFLTNNSGLPGNHVHALLSDDQGGLWIGSSDPFGIDGGLAHYNAQGQWLVFKQDNSGLPSNWVNVLLSDGQGGLWIGTNEGLVHYNSQGEWQVFNTDNSGLSSNQVTSLLSDGQGGLWIGSSDPFGMDGGLAHYNAQSQWQVFKKDNSGLPSNLVYVLLSDGQGGLWIGINGGLAHYNAQGQWQVFNLEKSGLPTNSVSALLSDSQGGLWVGTGDGLAHYAQGQWQVFNTDNSGLPGNDVTALHPDGQGGLWVGTGDGLAHYAQGQWQVFNTDNSGLPGNFVTALHPDGQGGLWVGTSEGLAHYAQGQWQVFNTDNSGLPINSYVNALLSDSQGGLWVGAMYEGLAHYAQGQWQVFNTDNSRLPHNYVYALLSDNQGGLWVGTSGGFAHYTAQGEWQVFNIENSGLPEVHALLSDNQGGLWVGTYRGGLAHYNLQGLWQVFGQENSGLPSNYVSAILPDSQGGLWVGTLGGLAHLTFTQKTALCQTTDDATCEKLQANKRAAIIIAGGGTHLDNALWDTTEFISNKLYNVLNKRGFDNDEIYYLTPKSTADFNGDELEDKNIVDSPHPGEPLTLEDVRATFEWAKSKGKLDTPLYLFFIDHGDTDKLQLSKTNKITAPEFKAFLDDYQTATGNDLILLIDACYSGTFSQQLADTRFRRALISSTNDTKAYFDRAEKQGFSRSFAKFLDKGKSFKEAFEAANQEQQKLLGNLSQLTTGSTAGENQKVEQVPQLNDGNNGEWVRTHYLNNLSTTTGDETLGIESATSSSTIPVGQAVTLTAKTSGIVSRAWATVRPPKMNLVLDTSGTPILAYPRVILGPVQKDSDTWQTIWNDAVYNGDYSITFYTEDQDRNIASSDVPLTLTVTGGIDPPTTAQVQIHLEKDRYQRGEAFKATLTEELGWGYDLYAAVLFPDGQNFMTLKNTNELRPMNEAKPWYAPRKPHSPLTLFELTLPADLPTGKYCLFGILSPEQNEVFETLAKGLWVMDSQCFEIVP